jgi:hypothetical protein
MNKAIRLRVIRFVNMSELTSTYRFTKFSCANNECQSPSNHIVEVVRNWYFFLRPEDRIWQSWQLQLIRTLVDRPISGGVNWDRRGVGFGVLPRVAFMHCKIIRLCIFHLLTCPLLPWPCLPYSPFRAARKAENGPASLELVRLN